MPCPRAKLKLSLLIFSVLALSAVFYFKGGKVAAIETSPSGSQEFLSDPGLTDGENFGCKYSNLEGLVYFCGYVKNSTDSSPVEGVTVAVYEELPKGPSALNPTELYSGSGKYGGNLVHLFTSTSTNEAGHFEITGRRDHNVYVAFLCGDNMLGGLKRIEELSRIEYLDEFVNCNSNAYIMKSRVVYRKGNIKIIIRIIGNTIIKGSEFGDRRFQQ